MSVAYTLDHTTHLVRCATCAKDYDTISALWCRCVGKDFAPACPRCGACICRGGTNAITAFWFTAPEELRRRRAAEKLRRSNAQAQTAAALAHRVLVVDDDEEIRIMAEFSLHEMGYRTLTASRADEALELVSREKPDFVLTDALMPGGDGRELCKTIKAQHPDVKVVIMTSLYTSPRYASEAHRLFHADGYLAKPIDFDRLKSVLRRLW